MLIGSQVMKWYGSVTGSDVMVKSRHSNVFY